MDVKEALQFADQWTEGATFYEGMQGWRVVCAVLAAEVRRLRVPVAECEPFGYVHKEAHKLFNVARSAYVRGQQDDYFSVPVYKHLPADVAAQILALEIAEPIDWVDRRHNGLIRQVIKIIEGAK